MLENLRMSTYRRVFAIHWLSSFGRNFSFFFFLILFKLLSTSSSAEITALEHFYSRSRGVIFNGRITGLLATLRSNNRSGALKEKQRTAQKQSAMAEQLEGLAFFRIENLIFLLEPCEQ